MKTWRLVSGILSCVLFAIVELQSCAAGFVNAVEENGEVSGSVGFIVGILILAGGIVSIVLRKSTGKKSGIALAVIFGLAGIIGLLGHGNYSDLVIWSIWCLVNALLAVVSIVKGKKAEPATQEDN